MSTTNNRPKVLITRRLIPQPAIDLLAKQLRLNSFDIDHYVSDDMAIPRDELLKRVEHVDGLFCLLTEKIDRTLLDNAKNLKVIGTFSVGYDHIDVNECRKRGIKIGNTPDVLTETTAELTVALLLCTARRLIEASEQVKNGGWGTWTPLWMCGKGIESSTIGILGLGRIGASVARKLAPFLPARIVYHNRNEQKQLADSVHAEYVPTIDELFAISDFVIICCALNDATRHVVNARLLSKMKSDAILINTSRGGIIDQDALYDALADGRLGAAGIDVTDPEPLPTDHKLLKLKNCVILPHIGSATIRTRTRMALLAAENIIAGLLGQPMPTQIP